MKIIITESQYKLIIEREDEKNIQEMRDIYDSFMDKINRRDYILEDSDNFLNPYKWVGVFVDTPYGELFIKLTDRKTNRAGEYNRRAGMIVIYYCEIGISKNNRLLKLKLNHQNLQHEIVHFIDDMKNRMGGSGTSDLTDDEYYNSSHEINAQFISIMNQLGGNIPISFDEFLKLYREYSPLTIKQFDNLTDKNRKSLINRLYQYYMSLKNKPIISENDNKFIMFPMDNIRRPNGSVGHQGFTPESIINLVRHISDVYGLNLPEYDSLKDLILTIREQPEVKGYIMDYLKSDPIRVIQLPDETYHLKDGNHRANLLNLLYFDSVPAIIG